MRCRNLHIVNIGFAVLGNTISKVFIIVLIILSYGNKNIGEFYLDFYFIFLG